MKKVLFLLLSIILSIGLIACGEVEEQVKEIDKVETSGDDNESEEPESEEDNDGLEENEETTEDYGETILDSDNAIVVLESITTVSDDIFGDYHEIKLNIENRSDETIIIQADEVSIDGLMVTDNVFFSEEVSAGKKANGKMKIEFFDDDLPPLDEELEFILKVIDNESFMTVEEENVSISIK